MRLSGRLSPRLGDAALALWFLAWSAVRLYQLGVGPAGWETAWFGSDFRIYRNAALALLGGGDPWSASSPWAGREWHFAAPPIAAQAFVPFALLPELPALALYTLGSLVLALAALRALRLPPWWLLFPPLVEGLAAGNPQIPVFGLLVAGARSGSAGRLPIPVAAGRAIAVGLKVYAAIPILARREWRAAGAAGAVLAGSVAAAPGLWLEYAARFGEIGARLARESVGGVSAALLLDPAVFGPLLPDPGLALAAGLALYGLIAGLVVLVAVRDVPSAGWLAVPLLWPAAEYHYATFALPIARRLAIWIVAAATVPTYLLGSIVLAYEVAAGRRAIVPEDRPVGVAEWLASLPPIALLRRRAGSPADSVAGSLPDASSMTGTEVTLDGTGRPSGS
ncbi:MAG TPA: glycosyltransferase 87 family protein [Candidatus Limnocylindrales bacterium]|nr:glycosyltransferase 87 family protein [Candidatus Limnocylindrales bacterium]